MAALFHWHRNYPGTEGRASWGIVRVSIISIKTSSRHQLAVGSCQIITQINPSSRKYQLSCKRKFRSNWTNLLTFYFPLYRIDLAWWWAIQFPSFVPLIPANVNDFPEMWSPWLPDPAHALPSPALVCFNGLSPVRVWWPGQFIPRTPQPDSFSQRGAEFIVIWYLEWNL